MTTGRVVAITGARPGLGVTVAAAEVASLAARAGNRVLLVDGVASAHGSGRRSRPDDTPVPPPDDTLLGLRVLRAASSARVRSASWADLVVLDAGAAPEGRRAAASVADHLVLFTAADPPAIERLVEEIEIGPRGAGAGPALLGVVVTGLPAEPRQPFVEARRLLRARYGEGLPVLGRPVRSAPFAAWLAQRHGLALHDLLRRPDVLPPDHPRRAEVAGLAADLRHLAQAMVEAIDRAEQGDGARWAASWLGAGATPMPP